VTNQLQELQRLVAYAEGGPQGFPILLLETGSAYVTERFYGELFALGPADLDALQQAVRTFLRLMVGGADYTAPLKFDVSFMAAKHEPFERGGRKIDGRDQPLKRSVKGPRRVVSLWIDGTPRDVLLHQVAWLLTSVGIDRLGVCRATDCGRVYVRITKKRFCSARCQSRTYMRKLRADDRAARRGTLTR
jgi:hypothetical protein